MTCVIICLTLYYNQLYFMALVEQIFLFSMRENLMSSQLCSFVIFLIRLLCKLPFLTILNAMHTKQFRAAVLLNCYQMHYIIKKTVLIPKQNVDCISGVINLFLAGRLLYCRRRFTETYFFFSI